MPKRRLKKSIWVPGVLLLYALLISCYFGPRLIAEGQSLKFWISIGIEAAIIIGLFFAFRHKEKLQSYWDKSGNTGNYDS